MIQARDDLPKCNLRLNDPTAKRVWQLFKSRGLVLVSYDVNNPVMNISIEFDLMRVIFGSLFLSNPVQVKARSNVVHPAYAILQHRR